MGRAASKAVATPAALDYHGPVGLEFLEQTYPVVLAPLAGYSVRPYRRICLELGAAAVWSGMISADGLVRGDGESRRLAFFDDAERPIGLQLFGADPAVLAEATGMLSETGPDFIDLNAGCPVRKVCKRNGGAALLKDPEALGRIVEGMVRVSRVPVTVKIRIGWQAGERNYLDVVPVLEEAGARAITVHGRTRTERFKSGARWEPIAQVVDAVSVPVIGNGDVTTPADAERMFRETGARAVMIGRAAMNGPWVFDAVAAWLRSGRQVPPPAAEVRAALCLRHARELVAERGEPVAMREVRKFVVGYSRGLPYASRLRRHLPDLTSLERLREALDDMLEAAAAAGER